MDKGTDRETRREAARERAEAGVQERLLARGAREREEDRKAGRPQRGLFTGRGRREQSKSDRDESGRGDIFGSWRSKRGDRDDRGRDRPRTGAKRSVVAAIRQLPSYVRLLLGLISDSRVSKIDRFFVIAAVAYIVSPIDFIPDIIPFFGEVDDVFLLMIALQRLVNHAGRNVLLAHWHGDPDELHNLNFPRIISAAGFFLPNRLKRRLFKMIGLGKRQRA